MTVASVDAPAELKSSSDYRCDGTADQVQINDAILEATQLQSRGGPSGGRARGTVHLSGGRFNTNGAIVQRTGVTLQGCGLLTEIRAVSNTATGMVMLFDVDTHMTLVQDLWLNGNYASGGTTTSGFHYISVSGGNDMNDDPASGNDPQNRIFGVSVYGFRNNANRHGMVMASDMRGTIISHCYLREIGGHAIWFTASPDSFIQNVFIGGVDGKGIYIQGANVSIGDSKIFYTNDWGFESTSGYAKLSNVEMQDCANGFRFASAHVTATGILADTIDLTGIEIAANGVQLNGFTVAHRTGARYADMNVGLAFTGTPNNCTLVGRVDTSNILTRITGTSSGVGNFVRVTGNSALLSVG